MPFHRPIPEPKREAEALPKRTPGLHSLVQAESIMQIAFVLPCAMVLGWGAGWCLDRWLHTSWGVAAGLLLGIVAGMVSAIRMAVAAMDSASRREPK